MGQACRGQTRASRASGQGPEQRSDANQQITYAPSIQISGSEIASSEKVGAVISQVMQNHFSTQFMSTMSTNPATRRDAALTDGVA